MMPPPDLRPPQIPLPGLPGTWGSADAPPLLRACFLVRLATPGGRPRTSVILVASSLPGQSGSYTSCRHSFSFFEASCMAVGGRATLQPGLCGVQGSPKHTGGPQVPGRGSPRNTEGLWLGQGPPNAQEEHGGQDRGPPNAQEGCGAWVGGPKCIEGQKGHVVARTVGAGGPPNAQEGCGANDAGSPHTQEDCWGQHGGPQMHRRTTGSGKGVSPMHRRAMVPSMQVPQKHRRAMGAGTGIPQMHRRATEPRTGVPKTHRGQDGGPPIRRRAEGQCCSQDCEGWDRGPPNAQWVSRPP